MNPLTRAPWRRVRLDRRAYVPLLAAALLLPTLVDASHTADFDTTKTAGNMQCNTNNVPVTKTGAATNGGNLIVATGGLDVGDLTLTASGSALGGLACTFEIRVTGFSCPFGTPPGCSLINVVSTPCDATNTICSTPAQATMRYSFDYQTGTTPMYVYYDLVVYTGNVATKVDPIVVATGQVELAAVSAYGDITGVIAGTGLNGGGLSGDVTVTLDTTGLAGCTSGVTSKTIWDAVNGRLLCAVDQSTQYTAGVGLGLSGSQFSLNTGGINVCTNPTTSKVVWDASSFRLGCATDANTQYTAAAPLSLTGTTFGLGTGGCVAGEVWKWTGTAWDCAPDQGATYAAGAGLALSGTTFSVQPCSANQVLKAPSAGAWGCGADADALGALACASNQIPKRGATSWSCAADQDTTYAAGTGLALAGGSFSLQSCAAGEILKAPSAGAWGCAADVGSSYTGASPVSVSGSTISLSTTGCAAGESWAWTGAAWDCAADQDTTYTAGAGLALTGTAFSVQGCAAGQVLKAPSTNAWGCGADADALGSLSCATGQLAKRGATSWTCAADQDTTYAAGAGLALTGTTLAVQACSAGQVLKAPGAGTWGCGADADSLGALACATGQVPKRSGSSWVCGADQDTTYTAGGGITLAGTQFGLAAPGASTLGGVLQASCSYGMVLTAIDATGKPVCTVDQSWGWRTAPRANVLTSVDTAFNTGLYPSLTIGADGLPFVAFQYSSTGDLRVLKCGNPLCTAGNVLTTVDTTSTVGSYASAAIGADGLPVIAHHDVSNGDLKVHKCGNAACTAGNVITVVDSTGFVGEHASIGIGADGLPVVSYYDSTNADLKVLKCGNAACSAGNAATTVDAAGSVGQFTSLAIGTDGLPVVSYHDATNADLKVVKCGNAACSAGNLVTVVDGANSVGQYTSIALGSDGYPVVSYYSITNGDLKVAKCGNAACSAGNVATVVDSADWVGTDTSIAIGADGFPMVTYRDITNLDVKFMKCGNAACSAGNVARSVDASGDTGPFGTSLVLGPDRLPLVAYLDYTNLDLKVAHLANEYGLGNLWRRG